MGTVFSLDIRGGGVDPDVVEEQIAFTHDVDARFSTFRADSEISRIADGRLAESSASADVRDVLDRCRALQRDTDGFFDAFAGGRLDPSGYVKGWAIQTVSDNLVAAGSTRHCVNGGGDVQCVGSATLDEPWRVGIAHPLLPATFADVVSGAGSLAVATSGTAERGRHVLDPHSGDRPDMWASVTVVGTRIDLTDAYATACLAMGPSAPAWLRARGLTAVLVRGDGTVMRIV